MVTRRFLLQAVIVAASVLPTSAADKTSAADVMAPVSERFQAADANEVPDFRKHVIPLMGKLGCNGRACHGSFQGRGGFRLSLFGYDFKADHEAMTGGEKPRVNLQHPDKSLVIQKPTSDLIHEGGQRYTKGSWEHHVFQRWIDGGAKNDDSRQSDFLGLDITPSEVVFSDKGQTTQLKVVARWADGTSEDVTPLCRFQSNDTQICEIDKVGRITAGEPGDTHVVVFYDNGVVPIPVMRPVSDKVGSNYPDVSTPTKVDELVVSKLRKLGIVPSEVCTDAEFLRRVSLDVTGTLPSPEEVKQFLADDSPDKRQRKIDELLKSPAYAAWWTTKLCDFTGNNDDALVNFLPVRGQASEDWYNWIYKRVDDNTPYDKIVEGIVVANSRNEGENFEEYCKEMSDIYGPKPTKSFADRDSLVYYWARRTFRRPEERAIGFAYTFLGMRIQCAQCHKHPFDRWTKNDFEQFSRFFASTQAGIRDRNEYQDMLKELGLGKKRGNQARRELAKLLKQGKVIPFPEVYSGSNRRGRNRVNRAAIRKVRQQIQRLEQRIASLKKADKTDEAKVVEKQLARQKRRLRQLARRGRNGGGGSATPLGAETVDLSKHDDPRVPLMKWLRDPSHGMLARAFVNRVWASYFNRGIIDPPDDLSLANPACNKPLLDYLTDGFIKSGYDMHWLHREILTSDTYQRSWKPNETNQQDRRNFSRAIPRRLPAEVLYDALQQATGSDEYHANARSNLDGRAIAIPGAGRRNRRNRGAQYALTVFGRSVRETNCDCDRSEEPSLLQTVYLQNDRDIYAMITRPRDGWLREVASEVGVRPPAPTASSNRGGGNRRLLARLRVQGKRLQKRLQQARKQGNKKQAAQLLRQMRSRKRRYVALTGKRPDGSKSPASQTKQKAEQLDAASIVKQAYLRTLSRYPTDEELTRAVQYIREADSTINGLRDVLWALVNTKEFIVNH